MGLDQYLFKRGKNNKTKLLIKLESGKDEIELMYWRKAYIINEWFGKMFSDFDNCKDIILTKEDLVSFREFMEEYKDTNTQWENANEYYNKQDYEKWIIELNKIIEETDFENEEIFYYAWW